MKAEDEHVRQVMVGFEIWMIDKLDIIAQETHKPRSQVVREAVLILFKAYDRRRGIPNGNPE